MEHVRFVVRCALQKKNEWFVLCSGAGGSFSAPSDCILSIAAISLVPRATRLFFILRTLMMENNTISHNSNSNDSIKYSSGAFLFLLYFICLLQLIHCVDQNIAEKLRKGNFTSQITHMAAKMETFTKSLNLLGLPSI